MVKRFLATVNIIKELGGGGHPGNELPEGGGEVDPGYGVEAPAFPSHPIMPVPPGGGAPSHPIAPGGPSYPIWVRPDNSLPGSGGRPARPDHGLPGGSGRPPRPDQGLPGSGGRPPRPDQGLPGSGGRPDNSLPGTGGRPPRPDHSLPGSGGRPDNSLPPIFPPLPPTNKPVYPPETLYLLAIIPGVGWRYVLVDLTTLPDNTLPPEGGGEVPPEPEVDPLPPDGGTAPDQGLPPTPTKK
jgi:hypothetical protein